MTEDKKTIHIITAPSGVYNDRNFHVYYDVISRYSECDEDIFIGEKNKCRFCFETNPLKFNSNAHTCPEFTGNKSFFSNDECDTCNSIFSRYETELSNHSHFTRTLFGMTGKNKSLSFISNSQHISFQHNGEKLVANIDTDKAKGGITPREERVIINMDFLKNELAFDFKFKQKKYVPLFMFKALNKIAFSIMPQNELNNGGFEKFITWLRMPKQAFSNEHEKPYFHICHNQFSDLKLFRSKPMLILFKKREQYFNNNIPMFSFLFMFANYAYQVFIPFYKDDESFLYKNTLYLYVIPEIFDKTGGKTEDVWMDAFSPDKTVAKDFNFVAKGSM